MEANAKPTYIPALDGLRGIAVIAVMLHHIESPIFVLGELGVDLFFVLSGFLITYLLASEHQRTGGIDLRGFYVRRILRLMPALVCVILVALILISIFGSKEEQQGTLLGAWTSLLYISNWAIQNVGYPGLGPLNMVWSLAIEDQFYIVWAPVLARLLWKRLPRGLIIGVLAAAIAGSAVMCAIRWNTTNILDFPYFSTDARGQSLLIGCILGLLYQWGYIKNSGSLRRICSLVLLLLMSFMTVVTAAAYFQNKPANVPLFYGGFTIVALGSAAAILLAINSIRASRVLSVKPLVWIGSVSYGIYLWHYLIFWFLSPSRVHWDPLFTYVLCFGLSFAAAAASYYLIERKFLALKAKLSARRAKPEIMQGPPNATQERYLSA